MSEAQAIAYTANFSSVAVRLLVECLEANGALRPGQFQKALKGTLAHPQSQLNRLDYVLLGDLLNQLDSKSPD